MQSECQKLVDSVNSIENTQTKMNFIMFNHESEQTSK